MKTYTLLLGSLFFFILNAQSQSNILDSLEKKLLLHTKEDTVRINILSDITSEVLKKNSDSALLLIDEIELLSKKLNFKKGMVNVFFFKGQIEFAQYNYEKSISYYNKSIEVCKSFNYKEGISNALNGIGTAYNYLNEQDKSIEYFQQSAKLYEELKDLKGAARILNNLGIVYKNQGKYEKAIISYKKAITIKKKLNDTLSVASSYKNLAILYEDQGNFPKALENLNKAWNTFEKINNKAGQVNTLLHFGTIYYKQNKPSIAFDYINKALEKSKKNLDKSLKAECLYAAASLYQELLNTNKSLQFYNEAIDLYTSINNQRGLAKCLHAKGLLYIELNEPTKAIGFCKEALEVNFELGTPIGACNSFFALSRSYLALEKYDKALENVLESQGIAIEFQFTLHEKEAADLLSTIYSKMGDYKKAFENHKIYKELNDSLFNEKNIEKITQLEYEYKYKQELESASNREMKLTKTVKITSDNLESTQRNYLVAIIIFLLVSIVLGMIIFHLKLRNVKSITENIVIEQKLLRSQMTPHFIFNALSVLQGIILNKENKKAVLYLSKFSKLLRITLENSRDKMVSLNQELAAVENYVVLQNIEVSNPYNYSVSVDSIIDQSQFKIPPMLIQPFIENAIEHGFENKNQDKKIEIYLQYSNNKLTCTITDNGIGIESQKGNKNQNKTSLSTTITAERLKFLSQGANIKGAITIEDRNKDNKQGTIVTLIIPYKIETE